MRQHINNNNLDSHHQCLTVVPQEELCPSTVVPGALVRPPPLCCLVRAAPQKRGSAADSCVLLCVDRLSWIQHVVVVVAEERTALMLDIVRRFRHTKVRVVPGGATRHRSIFKGVQALGAVQSGTTPDVVIIHDAVRPFVEEDFLLEVAMAAKENGVCPHCWEYVC